MRWLLVLALLVDVRTVHACTCGGYFAVPDGGAANVPINLKYLVKWQMGPGARPVELVSEHGTNVPLGEPEYLWGYTAYRYPLLAELAPKTTYHWAGFLSFQTGGTRDDDSPAAPIVGPMLVHIPVRDRNTCPAIREIEMELEPPLEAALIGLRFIDDDGAHEYLVPSLQTLRGGCGGASFPTNEIAYDLEVWLQDVAGNAGPRSRTSAYVTTAGYGCSVQASSSFTMLALLPLLRRRRRASRRPAI